MMRRNLFVCTRRIFLPQPTTAVFSARSYASPELDSTRKKTKSIEENLSKDFPQFAQNNVSRIVPDTKLSKIAERAKVSYRINQLPPSVITFLGLSYLPFCADSIMISFLDINNAQTFQTAQTLMNFQLNYAAIVLAVSGAVHFGLALGSYGRDDLTNEHVSRAIERLKEVQGSDLQVKTRLIEGLHSQFSADSKPSFSRFLWTLATMFLAGSSLGLTTLPATASLVVGYIVLCYYDIQCTRRGHAPVWFAAFKFWVTVTAIASLLVTLFFYLIYSGLHTMTPPPPPQVEEGGAKKQDTTAQPSQQRRPSELPYLKAEQQQLPPKEMV